jgi:polyvinyl alcohol dehydrogenase (cytochrome)
VNDLAVKWTVNAVGPILSNPSIVDDVAYFGDLAGFVYAVNASTGALIWQTYLPGSAPLSNPVYQLTAPFLDIAGVALTPTVSGSKVYVLTLNAFVVALDRTNGVLQQYKLLQDDPVYPQSGLTAVAILPHNQLVVALSTFEPQQIGQTDSSSGRIISLRANDLNIELWRLKTSQNPANPLTDGGTGVGIWGPLAYDKHHNVIYQGTGNNWKLPITPIADSLIAVDAATGVIKWHTQFTNDDLSGIPDACSPTGVAGKNWDLGMAAILVKTKSVDLVVIGQKSGALHAVDKTNGARIWDIVLTNPNPDGSGFGGVNTSGCTDGEVVYVPSHYSTDGLPLSASFSSTSHAATGIFAINAKDGGILWRIDVPGLTVGPLTVANEVVYHTSYDGVLRAINAKSGKILFTYNTSNLSGGTTVHNGTVYLPTGSIELFAPGQLIALTPAN